MWEDPYARAWVVLKPDKKPDRKIHGYDQSYLPQDQGLPEITSELKRIGLI